MTATLSTPRKTRRIRNFAAGALLFVLVATLLAAIGIGAIGVSLLDLLLNGWALYTFLRYREGRQDELFHVLAAAVERQMPLAAAVRSYLVDQPRLRLPRIVSWIWKFFLFLIYVFIVPIYSLYRLATGWHSFNRLVDRLANHLERGESLAQSLQAVPGVASREVRLAADVGEASGTLGACLTGADRERWSSAWLEAVPRLLYPVVILAFASSIIAFLMVFIIPRYKRIFDDFGERLPQTTLVLIDVCYFLGEYAALVSLVFLLAVAAFFFIMFSPLVKWYTPFIGRQYRAGIQGELLRTLGKLLAVGQTAPQALGFLARSHVLPGVVQRRLDSATRQVETGQPLNDALHRAGLLPTSMSALVQTSQRIGSLPATLIEMGDALATRSFRVVRRMSLAVAPVLIVVVGSVVGFVVIAMFFPLVQLLTRLSE